MPSVWRVHLDALAAAGRDDAAARQTRIAARSELLGRAAAAGPEDVRRSFLALPDNARILAHVA